MEDFDLNSDPWNVSGKKDLNEGTFSSESASGSGTEPEKSDGISYSVIAVPPGGDWSGTEKTGDEQIEHTSRIGNTNRIENTSRTENTGRVEKDFYLEEKKESGLSDRDSELYRIFAVISMICGILSILGGIFPFGIVALVLGILSKKGGKKTPYATIGIVCALVSIISTILICGLAIWLITHVMNYSLNFI